jgi:hypothetical protein
MYRVMNGSLLITVLVDQGKLDDAEQALAPLDPEAGADSPRRGVFASPADVCGSQKDESSKGWRTSWALA